ncbi:hypothetical protein P4657_19845, partial [Halalkalibacterium halodurans]|uniref:hypothetical protein n=1 Tax=Halalkalibacterium halodurans TaxID=86665 RepID=UPI0030C9F0EA
TPRAPAVTLWHFPDEDTLSQIAHDLPKAEYRRGKYVAFDPVEYYPPLPSRTGIGGRVENQGG